MKRETLLKLYWLAGKLPFGNKEPKKESNDTDDVDIFDEEEDNETAREGSDRDSKS